MHAGPLGFEDFGPLTLLGGGAMGDVYRGYDATLGREVAIKFLKGRKAATPEAVSRFEREARALAQLNHDNIAAVFGYGKRHGRHYIVMELVVGDPLDEYAAHTDLSVADRLELMRKLAEAVEHAHKHGVIHRDLKPSNVLVTATGEPKLIDFGLARLSGDKAHDATRTAPGVVLGTLNYMSPEQSVGDSARVDATSDVYSLGVIAYELLEGRLPYQVPAVGSQDAFAIIRNAPPHPLSRVPRGLGRDIEAVLHKALEKDKKRRYSSALELAADLDRAAKSRPVSATPTTVFDRLRRWASRDARVREARGTWAFYAVTAGFSLVFTAVGIATLLGLAPELGAGLRRLEFTMHNVFWSAAMGGISWLSRSIAVDRIPAIWGALVASVVMLLFSVAVVFGLYRYDAGGALDAGSRTLLYTLFAMITAVIVTFDAAALHAAYVRRRWEHGSRIGK